jgi:magnesium chelatase family protein
MLAKRIPSILPEMTFEEQLETTKLYSIAGELPENVQADNAPPVQASAPHRFRPGACRRRANPPPGEISLAHTGFIVYGWNSPEFTDGQRNPAPAD